MVTAEYEASTLDEYQLANLPQIEHRGYYYFLLQDNPRIAAQSGSIFLLIQTLYNYLFPVNIDAESATGFIASYFGHKAEPLLPDETTYEQNTLFSDLQLEQNTLNIFDSYQHEEFDADIAYEFTNTLAILIRANGKPIIRIINNLIKKFDLSNDIISETLKALGRIENENTKEERYQLLMGLIKDDSAIIRDGAVSGLSFLDDRRALPQIRMLFETEAVPILKSNIKVAIRSLETY